MRLFKKLGKITLVRHKHLVVDYMNYNQIYEITLIEDNSTMKNF